MKKHFTTLLLSICISASSYAQWTQNALNGLNVFMMKPVNGSLFAYGKNLSTSAGKLYRSNDNGNTWQVIDSINFQFSIVHDIAYDSLHNVYALVCEAQQGVYTSPDGNTWTNSGTFWSGDGITYINGQLVISLAASGVGISTNGGTVWNVSNSGLPGPFYVHTVTRIGDTLYLSNQGVPVYISTNYGASWTAYADSLIYFNNCYFQHQGIVYSGLYLNGVARHTNGFWSSYNTGLPTTNHLWTLCDATDTLFCGGENIGVWMNSTGTWQDFTCGLPLPLTVYKLLNDNGYLFAATANGIWKINLATGCNNVGFEQHYSTDEIAIYPTITQDVITILSPFTPKTLQVINVAGEAIETLHNQSSIEVRHYPTGIYFVRIVFSDQNFVVKKFMVKRD